MTLRGRSFIILTAGALIAISALPVAAAGTTTRPAPGPASPRVSVAAAAGASVATDVSVTWAGRGSIALQDNVAKVRPVPNDNPDSFSFTTKEIFWSVVAVASTREGDVDIELYDDAAHKVLLSNSTRPLGSTDFIAIDSNLRKLGRYFVSAFLHKPPGVGTYRIEEAQGDMIFDDDVEFVPMSADDLVTVRDTFLLAGTTYTISADPDSETQDASLFLMQSTPNPDHWVRNRNQAVAAASAALPGLPEVMTFTPDISDWYGLVLINEAGSGTYTLSRTS